MYCYIITFVIIFSSGKVLHVVGLVFLGIAEPFGHKGHLNYEYGEFIFYVTIPIVT